MTATEMRARHPTLVAAACFAVVLLLLAAVMVVQLQLSAVLRVALDSIDDPAAQELDESAPANAPSAHRGHEAVAHVATPLQALERVALPSENAVPAAPRAVSVPRAPPAA
jgi:hypothetical protein